MYEEHRFDSKFHESRKFDCGVPELNDYLVRRAAQDRRRNITQIYVLVDASEPTEILGFYTLSAAQIDADQISEKEKRRLPHYPIPCFRMGRFAVRQDLLGQRLGKRLLGCAVDRCLHAHKEVAAYALIVDAKSNAAKSFYEHFGFVAFVDKPFSLYLSMGR